jgi:ubiquinone/menaquinone biosynthesis C-methylase UbiE
VRSVPEAEFDQFAHDYEQQHAASIRMSGEAPDFFARYKIEDVAATLMAAGRHPNRILDFGAGIGNSLGPMRAVFPDAEIVLLDPSAQSLDMAAKRFPGQAHFTPFDGETIPFPDDRFDVVFVACVFHHIPEQLQAGLLGEIARVLAPGGSLFLFEHNPLNPLTRQAVRNCPFDKDAVLIAANDMRARIAAAGLPDARAVYRIFFPRPLARLRPLERFLTRFPLGAQYFVHAVKSAA